MYLTKATESLISPQECVQYAPVDIHSHGESRANFIMIREEKIFRSCFGFQFYLDLMADKQQYCIGTTSDIDTKQYVNFQENTNYALGTYVLYKDVLYKVTKATNGRQIPPLKTYFEEAEKFKTEAFDYLWKRYLRQILAFCVNSDSLMFRVVKDSADGIVKKDNGEYKGIATKEAATIRNEYLKIVDDLIEATKAFILENKEDFPTCQFVTDSCNQNCEKKVRHYGFNTNRR